MGNYYYFAESCQGYNPATASRMWVVEAYFRSRIAPIRIAASSGRVYSGGGAWPARSSSRTFVPDNSSRSIRVGVRAGLERRHPLALLAPEGVLEHPFHQFPLWRLISDRKEVN